MRGPGKTRKNSSLMFLMVLNHLYSVIHREERTNTKYEKDNFCSLFVEKQFIKVISEATKAKSRRTILYKEFIDLCRFPLQSHDFYVCTFIRNKKTSMVYMKYSLLFNLQALSTVNSF